MKILWPFFKSKRTEVARSQVNGPLSVGESYGYKTLFAGDIPQSGGEFVFMWNKVLAGLKQSNQAVNNALVLGVGTGTAVLSITKLFPKANITGIDLDPAIIDVAKVHFGLKTSKLFHIHITDATVWVKEKKNHKKYDLVVVDLFIGALNPPSARTRGFLKNLKNLLTADGKIIYNSQYQKNDPNEYQRLHKDCSKTFSSVKEIFSYPLNRVLELT